MRLGNHTTELPLRQTLPGLTAESSSPSSQRGWAFDIGRTGGNSPLQGNPRRVEAMRANVDGHVGMKHCRKTRYPVCFSPFSVKRGRAFFDGLSEPWVTRKDARRHKSAYEDVVSASERPLARGTGKQLVKYRYWQACQQQRMRTRLGPVLVPATRGSLFSIMQRASVR